MKKIFLTLLCIFTLAVTASAGVLTSNTGKVKEGYNFWLYTPDDSRAEETQSKPLVIFLHGASLCGSDLNRVKRYGTIHAIEKGLELDAYVVAPQNPGGSWSPKKVMNVVDYVARRHNVDADRIYVLGMSLGGYGTIDVAATYPDRIAAAMAFCGGGTVRDLSGLNEVPLWIIHGTADSAVSIAQSDKVVAKMRQDDSSTPRLIYDRVPGMGHGTPARFFNMPESYAWLFSHALSDEGRTLNEESELHTMLMDKARQPGRRKAIASGGRKKSSGKTTASKGRQCGKRG